MQINSASDKDSKKKNTTQTWLIRTEIKWGEPVKLANVNLIPSERA